MAKFGGVFCRGHNPVLRAQAFQSSDIKRTSIILMISQGDRLYSASQRTKIIMEALRRTNARQSDTGLTNKGRPCKTPITYPSGIGVSSSNQLLCGTGSQGQRIQAGNLLAVGADVLIYLRSDWINRRPTFRQSTGGHKHQVRVHESHRRFPQGAYRNTMAVPKTARCVD